MLKVARLVMKKYARWFLVTGCAVAAVTVIWTLSRQNPNPAPAANDQSNGQRSPAQPAAPAQSAAIPPAATQPTTPIDDFGGTLTPSNLSIVKTMIASGKIIAKRDSAPGQDGNFHRRLIVEKEYKYPYISFEQLVHLDPNTGEETILKSKQHIADHIIVRLKAGATEDDLKALCVKHGGKIRKRMLSGAYLVAFEEHSFQTAPFAVAKFSREDKIVKHASKDDIVFICETIPNDPSFGELYGLHNTGQKVSYSTGIADCDIDAPEAWDTFTGSTDILIAVIDTGIDYTHGDLAANCWINPGEIANNSIDDDGNGFVDDVRGWDFFNDDNNPKDDHNHGTHCAGTIGAVGNNSKGVAGVNWTANIMALKFIGAEGWGDDSDAIEALWYAARMKCRLTSNSWGGGDFEPEMEAAFGALQTSNCISICAAGNSAGNNDNLPHYPSSYTNDSVISVAATDSTDGIASFSCYGLTSVDIGAPGSYIYSTVIGNKYEYMSGTSMATPHVAGCATFVLGMNTNASITQLRKALMKSCDPLPALEGKCVTGGRINLPILMSNVGLDVASSSPYDKEVVSALITNFSINFTDACTPGTVDASDFLVDGTPADKVITNSTTSFTFNFTSAPGSAQGQHTMTINADSMTRNSDGRANLAWSAVYYYDTQPLTVASTDPSTSANVPVPFTSFTVNFNEAINTGTVDTNDIILSQGSVTGFNIIDADSVEYIFDGVVAEPSVTITIPSWQIFDTFGNPNAKWSAEINVDYATATFSTNLYKQRPEGCLVSSGTRISRIGTGSDTDTFTIDVDAGQTLAVIATPSLGLQPSIKVKNPSDATIGTANASAAGSPACLQPVACASDGTYRAVISGLSSSVGDVTVTMLVNAAPEAEKYGGPANDSPATAQDLDSSFTTLTESVARTAVLGGVTASDTNDWLSLTLTNGQYLSAMALGYSNEVASIEIYNSSAQLLTIGQAAVRNADSAIDQFRATYAGTYYIRIIGPCASYIVSIAKNSALELEKNNKLSEAMDISITKTVLGAFTQKESLFGIQRYPSNVTYITSFDPATGDVLRRFEAPVHAEAIVDCVNIAYDGENIWFNDGYGSEAWRVFYKLDDDTGEVIDQYVNFQLSQDTVDLGRVPGKLLVFDKLGGCNKLDVNDPSVGGGYGGTLYEDWGFEAAWGACGDMQNNEIFTIDQCENILHRHDYYLNILQETNTVPVGYGSGMAVIGDEVFISETFGIGTINALTVYDKTTLAFKRRMFMSTDFELSGLGGDGVPGNNHDWFSFKADAGDNIVIQTMTPAHDSTQPNEPHNHADPILELYDDQESLLSSDDNGAGDGVNSRISYSVSTSGTYYVKIDATNSSFGDYLLSISGSSTPLDPFTVASTDPANGNNEPVQPTNITVNFSQNILIGSLQASDVRINGTPCSTFNVVDGNSAAFQLPVTGEGSFTVTIAAGSITNIQGTAISSYTGTFAVDFSAPKVAASSIPEGGTSGVGDVNCTVTFNEPVISEGLSTNGFILRGSFNGTRFADCYTYSTSTYAMTLTFSNLQEDTYQLTLLSGDGYLEDLAGNDLDGEPLTLPSGNGTAGGDYVLNFTADASTYALPAHFREMMPTGSLAYVHSSWARIQSPTDTDTFTIQLDASQTVSVTIDGDDSLRPVLSLSGPAGSIGNSTAPSNGGIAKVVGGSAASAGTYSITVSSADNTTGNYELSIALNSVLEDEQFNGEPNNSFASAQNCTSGFLPLGGIASRNAVIGQGDGIEGESIGPDGYGYTANVVGLDYEDICVGGHQIAGGTDTGVFEITDADLGDFTFDFYGKTYSNLFVSVEGLITFGSGEASAANSDLTSLPTQPAIAVYWDDLAVTGAVDSAVTWQLLGTAPTRRLIIQWKNVVFASSDTHPRVNFQAILGEADGSIRLNFDDVYNTGISADGKTATIGIKDAGEQGDNRLVVARNSNSSIFVGTGKSVLISTNIPAVPTADVFAFDLTENDMMTFAVAGKNAGNFTLKLYDAGSNLVSTGTSYNNYASAVPYYVVPESGTYFASVQGTLNAEYCLMAMKNGTLDFYHDQNNSIANAQDFSRSGIAIGGVWKRAPSLNYPDFYKCLLFAGDKATFETKTPFDGGNNPSPSTLNPMLEIYDPSGSLITTNADGAVDGRNAKITCTAAESGYYYVKVVATTNFDGGAYILEGNFPNHVYPVVNITDPSPTNMYFAEGDSITVDALATITEGTVTSIDFIGNGIKFGGDASAPYSATWANPPAGTNQIAARGFGSNGSVSTSEVVSVVVLPLRNPENPTPLETGLAFDLYYGIFTSVTAIEGGYLAANGLSSTFIDYVTEMGDSNNYYGLIFSGYIQIPTNGLYTFTTRSDAGSTLWIGDTRVVNNDGNRSKVVEKSGSIALNSGWHAIKTYYFDKTGSDVFDVSYSGPGIPEQPIPSSVLYHLSATALPVIRTYASDSTLGEEMSDSNGTFTVTRSAVNLGSPLTVYYTLSGAAVNGSDYKNAATSVVISASSTSATISITAILDNVAEGDESVLLSINPSSNYSVGYGSASMSIEDRPIDSWLAAAFTPAELLDLAISGRDADPDLDGIPNLAEYAIGQDPWSPDSEHLPVPATNSGFFGITYHENKQAHGITYLPEAVSDLMNDSWSGSGFVEINRTDEGAYWSVTVRDGVPMNGSQSRFIRLRVRVDD